MKYLFPVLFIAAVLSCCGKANSSSRRAEIIPSPSSDVQCFIILDDDGRAVGGNCVKR